MPKKRNRFYAICAVMFFHSSITVADTVSLSNSKVPFSQFVSIVSQHINKTIVVSDEVDTSITVFGANVDTTLEEVFLNVLKANNLDYTQTGNVIVVKPVVAFPTYNKLTSKIYNLSHVYSQDIVESLQGVLDIYSGNTEGQNFKIDAINNGQSLLVTAPIHIQLELENLITQYDTPQPQVNIKAALVETRHKDIEDYGFEFLYGPNNSKFSLRMDQRNENLNSLFGGIFARFTSNRFDSFVNYLDTKEKAEVVSTPNLTVLSGSQASISVGQNVPFITGQSTSDVSDTSNPFQTIERQDIGLIMTIKPLVTSDGLIILDVTQELSSINSDLAASDIITNKRQITTRVRMRDGQSVSLGGLVSVDMIDSDSSVPVISDIPLIGLPFKSKHYDRVERKLSILINANILK